MKTQKTILVIEDEKSLRGAIVDILRLKNFLSLEAKNGREGVRLALSKHPALILLDIIMPEMDGFGVLEAIRDDDTINSTPVVVMSNLAQEDHLKRAKALGAKDYIVKSQLTPMDVVKKIKEVLAR